jgi:hypothetical protein
MNPISGIKTAVIVVGACMLAAALCLGLLTLVTVFSIGSIG